VVIEKGIMDEKTWKMMMNPKRVTGPGRGTVKKKKKRG